MGAGAAFARKSAFLIRDFEMRQRTSRSRIIELLILAIGWNLIIASCGTAGSMTFDVIPTTAPFKTTTATSTATPVLNSPEPEEDILPIHSNSPGEPDKTDETIEKSPTPSSEPLTITIIYDNNAFDQRLKTAWGFSALVEYQGHTLLFDTGADGPALMENMNTLGIDPTQIDSVVLSHAHSDHTGGLVSLLDSGIQPKVYLLPSFTTSFKNLASSKTEVIEVTPGLTITEGIYTTGEMGQSIPEQALVIKTETGLVILTGCAHPGIISIIEQAQQVFAEPIRLVMGGFHLGSKSKPEIQAILEDFRRLKVEQVAPCHCTGEQAIAMFKTEFGEDFIQVGVGKVISLPFLS